MSKNSAGQPENSRPKGKGGRPTRYRKEFAEQAGKLCRLGATDVELADFFGVGERTLNDWKKNHREFLQSLKEGKSQADAEVESKLFKRATGYSHVDTKFATHEGKITDAREYVKHYPPDTIACIFWLKNRRPDLWRDKIGHEHTGKDGSPIRQESDFKVTPEDERFLRRKAELVRGSGSFYQMQSCVIVAGLVKGFCEEDCRERGDIRQQANEGSTR